MKKFSKAIGKISLVVFSILSFLGILLFGDLLFSAGLSYLYHSQAVTTRVCIFYGIAIVVLVVIITSIALMFFGKEGTRVGFAVWLLSFSIIASICSFVGIGVSSLIGPYGCSYTENIANYGVYDNHYDLPHFPAEITEEMTVVDYRYFYKFLDSSQTDIYLEVKFKNKETMDKFLSIAKNAFSENGSITYTNPYNPIYTDIVDNKSVLLTNTQHFASSIDFDEIGNSKYVDMQYSSISYSYEELTIIYNHTSIGSDIYVGDDPDHGLYYPKYLERFCVEWSPENNFKFQVFEP